MQKSLPLFQAIFDKNEAKFLKLVKSGKYPLTETDPSGRMLLSNAVVAEMPEAVGYLIQHQPNLPGGDEKGWTALHFASYCNTVTIAGQLLPVFPNIDVKDNNGNTALWRAVYEEQEEMVRFLIEAGADPSVKNQLGDSPLDLAKQAEAVTLIEYLS